VLFSTHVRPDVEDVCDRVLILDAGAVRAEGTLDALCGQGAARESLEDLFVRLTARGAAAGGPA
jgi:ABC-type Na+ transport system ATPase subunit NatA